MTTSEIPTFGNTIAAHDPLPDAAGPDPDVAPVEPVNMLAVLEADLAAEIKVPEVTLAVPYRPGYTVTFRCGIDSDSGKAWAKRARDKQAPDGIDRTKYSAVILANTAVAIRKDGQPIGADDTDVTFQTPDLQRLLGADRAAEAVLRFYGGPEHLGDGHVINHANRVTAAAGYDDADLTADPTPG